MRKVAGMLVALVAACGVAFASLRLQSATDGTRREAQVLYLPSGRYLKVVSLGYPEVMADLIYIWSIQFYSDYDRSDRFAFLEHVYGNVITELDPLYIDPYLIGSMIMSLEAEDHEMSLRLLDKGIAANPSEWILSFEAGFTCYHALKDFSRAARYFEQALAVPGVPNVVRRLHAEMYNKSGDKRKSLGYWGEILGSAETDFVKDVAARHVHDLTLEIDLESLRAAIAAHVARVGRIPGDLDALVTAGILPLLPSDPEGNPYRYDARTGDVSSVSRFSLMRWGP